MANIPKPLLVSIVLVVGIAFFFIVQRPHSLCDAQKQAFIESQKGFLFPSEVKGQSKMPIYGRYQESCKLGSSPGACYELFNLVKKISRDIEAAQLSCIPEFADLAPLEKALTDVIELMSLLAWGSKPPDTGMGKVGWLEASDLNLFCRTKKIYMQVFGQEKFEELRLSIQSRFPGEEIIIKEGACLNCDSRKTANQTLSKEEIWVRSLFSIRCDQY